MKMVMVEALKEVAVKVAVVMVAEGMAAAWEDKTAATKAEVVMPVAAPGAGKGS